MEIPSVIPEAQRTQETPWPLCLKLFTENDSPGLAGYVKT